jgi:hypothetical protein
MMGNKTSVFDKLEKANARISELERAIRRHRDYQVRPRNHTLENDERLYAVLPEEAARDKNK